MSFPRRFAPFLPLGIVVLWILWRQVPRELPVPAVLAAEPVPVSAASIGLSAEEILARAVDTYHDCSRFREEGYVRGDMTKDGSTTVTDLAHFRLALERPGRLTWQWRKRHSRRYQDDEFTTLVRDGSSLRLSSDLHRETITPPDVASALAIDHWQARALLWRLLPEDCHGRTSFDSEGARLQGVELVDGHECFRVEHVDPSPAPARLATDTWWIDCESFLLRRSLSVVDFVDYVSRFKTAFEPELDPVLSRADFEPVEL